MDQGTKLIDVSELAASWPKIVDDIEAGITSGVDVVREGRIVVQIRPPRPTLHGAMRGSLRIPDGFDLTAPAMQDATHAELGRVHE